MKMLKIVAISIIALIVIIYAYLGGFKKINFQLLDQGGETLVYEEMTGDYRQSAAVMDKIYYLLLNDYNIESYKGFGLYFDNPQKVEKEKLRSEVGCILENIDSTKISLLKDKYKIKAFPRNKYLVTEFPYKNKLSVFVGIIKVYPALNRYLKEKGFNDEGAVMEIYDTPNKKIIYRKAL